MYFRILTGGTYAHSWLAVQPIPLGTVLFCRVIMGGLLLLKINRREFTFKVHELARLWL